MMHTIPAIHIPGLFLIGIHGKAGSGKDTIAEYIVEKYSNVYTIPFAQPLKDGCAAIFGIHKNDFSDPEVKEVDHPAWGVSPRMIVQYVGTEMFRERISGLLTDMMPEDFWVQRLAHYVNGTCNYNGEYEGPSEYTSGDTVIVPDVRFPNEAQFIQSNGGWMIVVAREGQEGHVGLEQHASEAGIDKEDFDPDFTHFVNNNGTLEDLYAQLDPILDQIFASLNSVD